MDRQQFLTSLYVATLTTLMDKVPTLTIERLISIARQVVEGAAEWYDSEWDQNGKPLKGSIRPGPESATRTIRLEDPVPGRMISSWKEVAERLIRSEDRDDP